MLARDRAFGQLADALVCRVHQPGNRPNRPIELVKISRTGEILPAPRSGDLFLEVSFSERARDMPTKEGNTHGGCFDVDLDDCTGGPR